MTESPTEISWYHAVLLILSLTLSLSTSTRTGVFDPAHFTLENGLEVVVVSDHRAPVVTQMVWYRVGAADEGLGKSGIAHFLEHLMFKGTDKLGPGEASRIIARIGGNENAFTSQDYTAYYQTVAPNRLDTVMGIEADRMVNLKLDLEHVLSERDVILEERRTRTDNSDAAKFREQVNAAMFLAYPYRIPVIGWEHEMRQLSQEDAINFYRRWYAPNNAILIVAGDVSVETVRALAEKHYAPIPRREIAKRDRVDEPPQLAPRRLSMTSAQVGQAQFARRYLAPSHGHGAGKHVLALEVLTEILGGGTMSRLYRTMVVEAKVAVSAGSWYGGDDIGPSTFGFYGNPTQGKTVEEVEVAIDTEISKLLETGVTQDELATAIKRLTRSAIFARDSVTAPARIIGAALASGQSIEAIESWPERVAKVTVADVAQAAKAVLAIERSVTSTLLPEGVK